MTRDPTRPLPFAAAARATFWLSIDDLLAGRRRLGLALLLTLPVAFALAVAAGLASLEGGALDTYGFVVVSYYLGQALPLVALVLGSGLVAEEVEGRTITYLFTRPISRSAILVGKFGAYLAATLAVALPALTLTFLILLGAEGLESLRAGAPDLLRDLAVASAALAAYGALFTLLGAALRKPLIPGLLFLYLWELLASLPGDLPRVTVAAYLRSLVRHRPAEEGFFQIFGQRTILPAGTSVLALGLVVGVGFALALVVFSRRDYVLEH